MEQSKIYYRVEMLDPDHGWTLILNSARATRAEADTVLIDYAEIITAFDLRVTEAQS